MGENIWKHLFEHRRENVSERACQYLRRKMILFLSVCVDDTKIDVRTNENAEYVGNIAKEKRFVIPNIA